MFSKDCATEIPGMQGGNDMNRPLIRFATAALIATLGISTAFAGSSGGGTRIFVGESIPVVDKTIVKPAPQPKPKPKPQGAAPVAKPTQDAKSKPGSKPGPDPKPGPKPRPVNEVSSVVYYTDGIEVNIGQVQQAVQELQPVVEQVLQNMPSAEEIQEMARQLQGPVTQQVEQAVEQLPEPMQEVLNEPIIITPQSVSTGGGSKSKRRSKWTYDIPGMTGGDGSGPLIYNP